MTNEAGREVSLVELPDSTVEARLAGSWRLRGGPPGVDPLERPLELPRAARRVTFETRQLSDWDSSLVVFLERVIDDCRLHHVDVDRAGLPDGVRRLLSLAEARTGEPPPPSPPPPSVLARVGEAGMAAVASFTRLLGFVGELAFSLGRLVTGRARYRRIDLLGELQSAGASALPIVTVVGFLLGMILAFVGDVTLRPFGASIYVANVVTVGMVRELGPVMTAIVMAGRTGSAYAAQLGTMRVTEEIDALTTMGLPPMDFLVLPRVLALSLMMPLLCVQANFVAMVGGALVAIGRHLGAIEYLRQSKGAIELRTFWIGLFKSAVFGVIVAMAGCVQGLRAGRSAAAVGDAATRAVVTSIVWIIAVDGIFAVMLYLLGW
jgi:phospholipid/cholesterol/gamma-HCH transport system permease protein